MKIKTGKVKVKKNSPKPNLQTWLSYNSNNSGGSWWLKDKDWKALEKAGWLVFWSKDHHDHLDPAKKEQPKERWLGALATSAAKQFDTAREGVIEFESITGQDVSDEGCNCCGNPHNFTFGVTKDGTPPKNCYDVDGVYYSSEDFVVKSRKDPW